jgi:DNA-binding NarL/FixJ family response regulator
MIHLGIVEDDQFIRFSFHTYLSQQEEFEVVQVADSVESFLALPHESGIPDVLLLDINLPGISGIEGIASIKEKYPQIEILMITVFTDPEHIFEAICAGATGYLVKNTPLPQMKESILQLSRGEAAITPSVARKIVEYFNPQKKTFKEDLSDRELDVIKGIVDGLSYKLIADRMCISIDTVRTYVKRTYRKLQINSKAELISKYHRGDI